MDSRQQILSALGRAARPAGALPELSIETLRFDDPEAVFAESLAAAGGGCRRLAAGADLGEALAGLVRQAGAPQWWSAVPALSSRRQVAAGADPRELADLALAVLPGEMAVAESGAVWVVPSDATARAALFLAERVVLAVARSRLVHNLHEAYARLPVLPAPFGCFVSGPSKTADIEQCLVIGAHGPRALDVVLFGED